MLHFNSFFYFCWGISFLVTSLVFMGLFIWLITSGCILFLDFSFTSIGALDLLLSVVLTPISSLFSFLVLFITFCVIIFSSYYMSSGLNTGYFVWLTVLFVASILVVINFGDLFSLILGWDGLGIISFFLIVYYQSSVSLFSGAFTLFINRVGDGLLLVSIVALLYYTPSPSFVLFSFSILISCSMVIGFITNSALFPFSPWLPAAIAAPTPISSLVHSSTLVTAGLYLMLRFSDYLYSSYGLCSILCISSVFTSFYAGVNSLVEVDLKKVVALSTLSHLGFIGLSISIGWSSLAYIHLISHAVFNSLMFISLGSIMVSMNHYQDSRYLSGGYSLTPVSGSIMLISVFSLLGFPFLGGFYSNDYVLEVLGFSLFSGMIEFIIYVNLFFTFSYAVRVFSSVSSMPKVGSFLTTPHYPVALGVSLFLLCILAVSIVSFLVGWSAFTVLPLPVLSSLKFFPLFLSLVVLFGGFILTSYNLVIPSYWLSLFSSMFFLSILSSSGASSVFNWIIPSCNNSLEYGVLNSFLNFSPSLVSHSLSKFLLSSVSSIYFITFVLIIGVLIV